MTTLQIRYFLELAKTLNFRKAAADLFVSQPAFSKQIMNLEEELGVKLAERDNKKVTLTPAGLVFQTEFTRIVSEMDAALGKVKSAGRKTLNIGLYQMLSGNADCFSYLSGLSAKLSDYEIRIRLLKFGELMDSWNKGEEDLYLAPSGMVRTLKGAVSGKLASLGMAFVCSESVAGGKPLTTEILNGRRLVLLKEQSDRAQQEELLDWLKAHGCVPSKVECVNELIHTVLFTDPGNSFAFMELKAAEKYAGQIAMIEIRNEPVNPDIEVFRHEDTELPENVLPENGT